MKKMYEFDINTIRKKDEICTFLKNNKVKFELKKYKLCNDLFNFKVWISTEDTLLKTFLRAVIKTL